MIRFRRVTGERGLRQVVQLNAQIFPDDPLEAADKARGVWWVAFEGLTPVGFCGVRKLKYEDAAFLCRAGLLPSARGQGLQRRMIQLRLRWMRAQGIAKAVTYTMRDNYPSANNLIKCGFLLYEPPEYWGGTRSLYFMKEL